MPVWPVWSLVRSDLVLPLPIWHCNNNNSSSNNSSNYRISAPELHRQPAEVAAEAAGHDPLHQRHRAPNHLRYSTCQERRLRISLRQA